LLVGQALLARGDVVQCVSWGVKGDAGNASLALNISRDAMTTAEAPVELAVSNYLSTMPFLWLNIDDQPRPNSLRGVVERNAIALLCNHERPAVDPPSPGWLGHSSDRPLVRSSGLWNQRHVEETHDPMFLDTFEKMIERTSAG
jgi:hypothetical protein